MEGKMEEATRTLAARLRAEAEMFCDFFMREVEKIEQAASTGDIGTLCEREKVVCAGLGSARERILAHCERIEPFVPEEFRVVGAEVTNILRKEYQRVLKSRGILKTSPVVSTIGYHGADRDLIVDKILQAGGAYSRRITRNTVTHVVATRVAMQEAKAQTLRGWDIHVVTSEWLDASLEQGRWVPVEAYEESQESVDICGGGDGTENVRVEVKEEVEDDGHKFLLAVERLCEDTLDESQANNNETEHLFSSEKSSNPTRKRVSRAELLNDGQAGPSKKRQKPASAPPGTANTIGRDLVKKVENPSMERLPAQPPNPAHPSLPTTNGVESQVIRWDNSTSGNVEKKMHEKVHVKTFQLAGGGSVPKAKLHQLVKMIQSLNGEVELVPKYVTHSTHLLALCAQQLTEKYLSFVAAGKWIVRESYITESARAGVWLDEEDYSTDAPGRPIAYHRANFGGAFKSWKVILLLEPGGISVILRAGGCPEVWTTITPENASQATHVLTDTPGKDIKVPKPANVAEADLSRLATLTFSIEILYKILCVTIDENAAKQSCALNVTFE